MSLKKSLQLLIGKCMPRVKSDAAKISIPQMELDTYLNMYFRSVSYVFVHDPEKICKTGDIVLVEELPKKLTKLITFKVKEIVYPMGDVMDPLTRKKVSGLNFRSDIEEYIKLYGENKLRFKYNTAPPRGWQEGKKDFSDKPTYLKCQERGIEEPYAW